MKYYSLIRNTVVPIELIKNYQKYNLTEQELITILKLLSQNSLEIDILLLINEFGPEIKMELTSLVQKKLLIPVQNTASMMTIEPIYNLLFEEESQEETELKITPEFVQHLGLIMGRDFKPLELEQIKDWIKQGYAEKEIEKAIVMMKKKAIDNLKYANSILKNEKPEKPEENVVRNWRI